jgi:hypothetical protein
MKFSERYGHGEASKDLNRGLINDALKTRLWNVFYDSIVSQVEWPLKNQQVYKFLERCWDSIFKLNILEYRKISEIYFTREVKYAYDRLQWYEIFDLIEATIKVADKDMKGRFNKVLEQERSAYRIVNSQVIEITSEEEILEIEKVFSQSDDLNPVKQHLDKALKYFSNREKPDYENSIKESISSVESLVKIITGSKGTLSTLIKELNIHQALKDSITKLYAWTSDDGGIRHGSGGKVLSVNEEEARFILITCSAIINYLVVKCGDKNEN